MNGFFDKYLTGQLGEINSVHHMKYYVFDDDIILTGYGILKQSQFIRTLLSTTAGQVLHYKELQTTG